MRGLSAAWQLLSVAPCIVHAVKFQANHGQHVAGGGAFVEEPEEPLCRVSADWSSLICDDAGSGEGNISVNAMDATQRTVYGAFSKFEPWRGHYDVDNGNLVDFLGFKVPHELYCNSGYMNQPLAHAIRARQCHVYQQIIKAGRNVTFEARWPVIAEEYFEYADVLDAVLNYTKERASGKRRKFTFLEFGAGYGHWTIAAHKALMQKVADPEYKYVMVEAMVEMRPVVENLALLNDVRLEEGVEAPMIFHHGYLGMASKRSARQNTARYSKGWGVAADENGAFPTTVDIRSLLEAYHVPCVVDMVDIDIQGAEYEKMQNQDAGMNEKPGLFAGWQAIEVLTQRARRVHIGTHGSPANDKGLIKKFESFGWKRQWGHSKSFGGKLLSVGDDIGSAISDEWGPVTFADGILSYVNPGEIACEEEGNTSSASATWGTYCTTTADWTELHCRFGDGFQDVPNFDAKLVNAMDGTAHPVHSSFDGLTPWQGPVEIHQNMWVDFLGVRVPADVFCDRVTMARTDVHAVRGRQCEIYSQLSQLQTIKGFKTQLPVFADEYYGYVAVLDAVSGYASEVAAGQRSTAFTLVELGSDYGQWTLSAAAALRQKVAHADYKFVIVDAGLKKRSLYESVAELNGLHIADIADDASGRFNVHHGVVGNVNNPGGVPRVNLSEVLTRYGVPCVVDMLSIDIEGSEYGDDTKDHHTGLFFGSDAVYLLTQRVKLVRLVTPGEPEKDKVLMDKFEAMGWTRKWHLAKTIQSKYNSDATWGPVRFHNSMFTFINPQADALRC